MRTIYTPVDCNLLESGKYYWCVGGLGRTEPIIVQALRVKWRDDLWVISQGNNNTDIHIFDDSAKSDHYALNLIGPIPLPEF